MEAIVAGIVDVDPDRGCVWLAQPDGSRYPVVWPLGTTGEEDGAEGFTIVLADGRRLRAGDRVEGGGGYVPAAWWDEIPTECVQGGQVAVFNARSSLTVEPEVGLEVDETLVARLSLPASIPLELIAMNPNARSLAVVDLVAGTVHRYGPADYAGPVDAIDGASGGGGFIHVWSRGAVWSYPGRLDLEPLVYRPDPLVVAEGVASSLRVVPAVDGERTWFVQPGEETTLVELVSLAEVQVARLGSYDVEGSWLPVGATTSGLVLLGDGPRTRLIGWDGETVAEVAGNAVSVGREGAAIVQADGTLVVVDATLADPVRVEKPEDGTWTGIGGPVIPADAPPIVTAASRYLVYLADDPGGGQVGSGAVVVVDSDGSAAVLTKLAHGAHGATWTRDEEWVALVEGSSVTLVPAAGGDALALGEVIPPDHWLITAG